MINRSRHIKTLVVLMGVIILAFGIVVLAVPSLGSHAITILLGLGIVLEGASFTLTSSYPKNKALCALTDLILGFVLIVFGFIIIINTNITLYFVSIFIVFVAFVSLLHQAMVCFERRKSGLKYASTIIFGLVHGIFGGLLIYLIPCADVLIISIIGAYLLSLGAIIIISTAHPRQDPELI